MRWLELGYIRSCLCSFVEQISDDDSIGPDHMFTVWGQTIEKIAKRWGKPFNVWEKNRATLARAGFVDIVERRYKWPVNDWPDDPKLKRIGYLNRMRLLENIEAYVMRLLTGPGDVCLSLFVLVQVQD